MNLDRHGPRLSKTESRFPTKGTCLAIFSRVVNSEAPLDDLLRDYDDLLLAWAQVMADEKFAAHLGGMWDHVLTAHGRRPFSKSLSWLIGLPVQLFLLVVLSCR